MSQTQTTLLLHGAVGGDDHSRNALVEHLSPLLLMQANLRWPRSAWSFCEPEDLVQEVWLRILPGLAQFKPTAERPVAAFCSYLGKTLASRINDALRDHLRARVIAGSGSTSVLNAMVDPTNGAIARFMGSEAVTRVLAIAEAEMGATNREIFVMRAIEDRSFRAISEALKLRGEVLSEDSVKKRYQRALERLRQILPGSAFAEIEDE